MAMGHKEKLKGGDEYDFLTKARRYFHHKTGEIRKIKRKFWKRQRAEVRDHKKEIMDEKD
jgi:hypothetical protein